MSKNRGEMARHCRGFDKNRSIQFKKTPAAAGVFVTADAMNRFAQCGLRSKQLTKYEWQDAAMLVIIHFNRRIDAQ
jgi:hypothetical protein